jgi:ribosomal protein L7/L12
MTIQLNLTPKEAYWLYTQIAGLKDVPANVNAKLTRQLHKFQTVAEPLRLPGTGNVILAPAVVPAPVTADSLQEAFDNAVGGRDVNCYKIAAIKAIRNVAGCGLADSKWAVENWQAFINFVRAAGRLPEAGWSYQPMR